MKVASRASRWNSRPTLDGAAACEAGVPSLLRRWAQAWDQFWFRPADPLMLGLVRIAAGLIVLAVHWAYTYDLDSLLGKQAWMSLETANLYRRETPVEAMQTGWPTPDQRPPRYPEPDDPHQKDFIRHFRETWIMGPEPALVERELSDAERYQYQRRWEYLDPRNAYTLGQRIWSIWFHVTDPGWMRVVHWLVLGVMVLFTIGLCTRITALITWLAAVSYIQRAGASVFGVDAMMMLTLLYLVIGPSGAALSVDRLIARWRATRRALAQGLPPPTAIERTPMVSANVALRLLQIHFCLIYFAAGTSKLQGPAWWNGTALWGIYANYEFSPLDQAWFYYFLRWLCEHRVLWEIVMGAGAFYTLFLEISFPFLVWVPRLRGLYVAMAILLHTNIAIFMGLKLFSLIMVAMVIAFIPGEAVQRAFRWLGQGPRFRLWFNARSVRQCRAVSLIRAFDVFEQVEPTERLEAARPPASAEESETGQAAPLEPEPRAPDRIQLIPPAGPPLCGYDLFEKLLRGLRPLWPLAWLTWLPAAATVGRALFPPQPQPVA